MTTTELREAILAHLKYALGTDPDRASVTDWRIALSYAIRDRIVDPWFASTQAAEAAKGKRVYYLSMEFLIGRLLEDAVVNLGLMESASAAMSSLGLDLDTVLSDEPDAALGNGGLGRLAACFLESLATVGCPAYGYGIRYEHGLFRQSFVDGRQVESPEDWLRQPHAWEFERPGAAFEIGFGGRVASNAGRTEWTPAESVVAEAYDTPVIGWKGRWANTLRLWSAKPTTFFDLDRFNRGDYYGAAEPEALARTISRVLYPDDTTEEGKRLRLKQEYFFTAASLNDILRRFLSEHDDLRQLPRKVAIQLNDTHPAIAGPELVRLLHDVHGMPLDEAIVTARGCLSYTNHTLLPEALERWSEGLMGSLLPRHLSLIERIDAAHAAAHPDRGITMRENGEVKMGELAFCMAHKVNGVSALHTELMKRTVFSELHRLHPERILNQTNGVTPRRWVLSANPRLSGLLTDAIGEEWVDDLERLHEIEPLAEDAGFREDYAAAKRANKEELASYLRAERGVSVDPEAMFDVQIKRIHEYKRQHLNILEAIALWQEIGDNPNGDWTPRVKIFGGKAAPGYVFAKEIIHLINSVAQVINSDPVTSKFLKIDYPANYNVSLAERLIPASDLSEQISTAGKEASGTGNMKFALNGALTIGTLDGANVEIRELVGAENFFLFGMDADEVMARRAIDGHAARAIEADPRLARALDAIRDGAFSPGERGRFDAIVSNLSQADYFLVSSDFTDYWRAQREVDVAYRDRTAWMRMAILNTARSGWFSSDRTIRSYMSQIWNAQGLLADAGTDGRDEGLVSHRQN
ncbi:glycogen/starch/alpha-glucan phosphorylase [Profundibacterium mesophilum]|uniref:Alpha-1,4 glucan phosphorylase n=1 Tax=Profundibacterium mesophilum KAUST100406-0324 TaxID=1037889 RepID=A0A921NVL3_9RHOB|nr:glycogen/starch/alpha-glucan phosphorylase [Profundibacterium mesophilum]KAF0677509.1 Phosphorylase [Profundibacterium mesophilum KAUST100406-0324]